VLLDGIADLMGELGAATIEQSESSRTHERAITNPGARCRRSSAQSVMPPPLVVCVAVESHFRSYAPVENAPRR
jgi:hypothetical protein